MPVSRKTASAKSARRASASREFADHWELSDLVADPVKQFDRYLKDLTAKVTRFESARAESIRELGLTYADMEKMGVIMPVVDIHCRYLRPARYDNLLTIKTTLKELPVHHKIEFHHEVFNEADELLAVGKIILYFMEANGMKRTTMPAQLLDKLQPYFS